MRSVKTSGNASPIHSMPGAFDWFSNGITRSVRVPGSAWETQNSHQAQASIERKAMR